MLGAVDLDMPGGDIDVGGDFDVDTGGVHVTDGMSVLFLKWVNLRDIPLVIWLGAFSIIWWFLSASLWSLVDSRFFDPAGWGWSSLLVVKNLAIAVPITKWLTNPMKGWFVTEKLASSSLIGKECQISSLEATPEFGQVKFKTAGAPLLLNVRTDGEHLAQGACVWITHYDAQNRVYIVSPTTTNSPSEESAS